ncbi:MAG: PAS domain S-box protein [Desulfobacterales bacterium]|nr:PAS domain S-box protein [Desulfobacterales bacterium]MCP4160332.1 PAS domain S-box protein [Deltaproteobacteria bacterium]
MDIGKYWKTLVDTLQDGIMVVDPNGNILTANKSAERITGYTIDELLGKSCKILNCTGCKIINKPQSSDWCELFKRTNINNKKCMITSKEGRAVHILKSAKVLRDENDDIIGAVETLTDITESIRQQQEINSLKQTFLDEGYHGIIGKSNVIKNLFEMIENVAQSDTPVMIHGKSGTGKELIARAIHRASNRSEKPFIKVNCAALNINLLESELFGHVRGAYTGADKNRAGRFEAAHEGTILLDEIGDIPLSIQVKLLRVLEEKKIERVGENKSISIDVRIITATNKNLDDLVEKEEFREDLYFRINVFPLYSPSLSERSEDIPLIAQNYIDINAERTGRNVNGLTPSSLEKLIQYPWPGNVRELRNAIEYAFVLCTEGHIETIHLPPKIVNHKENENIYRKSKQTTKGSDGKEQLIEVLKRTGGNQSEAARQIGVSRITVWKRIKKYGIDLKRDIT